METATAALWAAGLHTNETWLLLAGIFLSVSTLKEGIESIIFIGSLLICIVENRKGD